MSEINWDEAPEGAERCCDMRVTDKWLRRDKDGVVFFHNGHCWKIYTSVELGNTHWNNATPLPTTTTINDNFNDGSKYERTLVALCGTKVKTDVYRVLDAFETNDPILDHLIKKALCAGGRGHKDKLTDYRNIVESAQKALILLEQKSR